MELIKIALGSLAGLGAVSLLLSCYKKCPTDKILVKYGLGGNKIFNGKGTIVIPFFQQHKYMELTPQNLDIILNSSSGLVSKDKIKLSIEADATFSISESENERIIASERLLSLDPSEISKIAQEVLTGQVRSIISEMTLAELLEDRKTLKDKVSQTAELELTKFGLDLINFNIKKIIDLDGIIETLGKKASATAQANAQIAMAEQTKESTIKVAEQEKQQTVTIAKTEADKTIEVSKSEIEKSNALEEKNSRIQEIQSIENKKREMYKITNTKELELNRIDADKEVYIKNQEKEQSMLDSRKVTTVKEAEVKLEAKRAEEIVIATVESEKKIVEQNAVLTMEKNKADNDLKIAETRASAIVTEAKAKAQAITLEAEALAKKEALPISEKAKAELELLKVYNAEQLVQMKFMEILPELTKFQAEAVKNLKIDSINIIGGQDSNGAVGNEISGTVNNILKSLPAINMANKLAESINLPNINITPKDVKEVQKEITVENM